jgi:hypothetical protein
MMDNFAQILQWMPTGNASSSRGHTSSFKEQVNFYIPLFEVHIYADVIDKWLNLLEGYFSVHNFSDREKIIFSFLKVVPCKVAREVVGGPRGPIVIIVEVIQCKVD